MCIFVPRNLFFGLLVLGLCFSCKKSSNDDNGDTTNTDTGTTTNTGTTSEPPTSADVVFPAVGGINLAHMGTAQAYLADEADCSGAENSGLFGMALGGACHTAPLVTMLMLGTTTGDLNQDGTLNCADYDYALAHNSGAGILLTLMCDENLVQYNRIVSAAGAETENGETIAHGVSFADFDANDGFDAIGHWTRGNTASYPANIRAWVGTTIANLQKFMAMKLENLNDGTLYVDSTVMGEGSPIVGEVIFSTKASTENCISAPSADNCHWQNIKLYPGEGVVNDGPPNGMHIKIFAENKENPTFLAIEGRYRYTAANAAAHFSGQGGGPDISAVRDIYFTAVQKGHQLWGRFMFKDANGEYIQYMMDSPSGQIDAFAMMRREAGVCQNFGGSTPVTCTDITYTDYSDLWEGEDVFAAVPSTFTIPDIFTEGKPTEAGVVQAE